MKDAMVPNAMPAAMRCIAHDTRILSVNLEGRRIPLDESFEAEVHAAHRKPAFAWLGLLALIAPWGIAAAMFMGLPG